MLFGWSRRRRAGDPTAHRAFRAACRGAVNVLEGHIREHVIDPSRKPTKAEDQALDQLAQLMKRYLK
ncbi:MAG: hypothetical protein JNM80_00875 [Phycisphaerae bacterium]|nr:hypothetical protein [Phycisphaerae bacterium]